MVATAIFAIFTLCLSLPGFASGVRLMGGVGGPLTCRKALSFRSALWRPEADRLPPGWLAIN
ncbi:hypothetical protein B1L11_00150 [Microbispora sp. GKU 823]|nr:hypothetical protein B1L11_00150 [Microbispora sp. GKU 823]